MNKMPEFYIIFARKILFPNFGRQFPALKLSERTRPQHQLRDHGGHRFTSAIVLNKLFKRLFMLIYSISLDA